MQYNAHVAIVQVLINLRCLNMLETFLLQLILIFPCTCDCYVVNFTSDCECYSKLILQNKLSISYTLCIKSTIQNGGQFE